MGIKGESENREMYAIYMDMHMYVTKKSKVQFSKSCRNKGEERAYRCEM